jgi:cytochrome c peroxidase
MADEKRFKAHTAGIGRGGYYINTVELRKRRTMRCFFASVVLMLAALGAVVGISSASPQEPQNPARDEYFWRLPKGFPKPRVPADNPVTLPKVNLGRFLFYDARMSVNGKESCATCHRQELAFTDGKSHASGTTGQIHPRGSMSLLNVAYSAVLNWSDPSARTLEQQALTPMFNTNPVELGMTNNGDDYLRVIESDPVYVQMFPQAFPGEKNPFTVVNITKAIASFERIIISGGSPYDRYHYRGDDKAISDSAKRGETLFFSEPLSCFRCHGGFNFSDATDFDGRKESEPEFHNTGLYNLAGALSYPAESTGIYEHTRQPGDVGKFKAPTLRNVAVTAPYMHDGSITTLEGVLDHYSAGGRTITESPYAGDGSHNPNKDHLVRGFKLTPQDRADLIAFLESLTDDEILNDVEFANPWLSGHWPTRPPK